MRGEIIPVIDLAQRLGYRRPSPADLRPPQTRPQPSDSGNFSERNGDGHSEQKFSIYAIDTKLLICNCQGCQVGMIINGLQETITINPDKHRHNVVQQKGLPNFVDGLYMEDKGLVQVVYIKKILSSEELELLQNS